jgi:hypothetical protein
MGNFRKVVEESFRFDNTQSLIGVKNILKPLFDEFVDIKGFYLYLADETFRFCDFSNLPKNDLFDVIKDTNISVACGVASVEVYGKENRYNSTDDDDDLNRFDEILDSIRWENSDLLFLIFQKPEYFLLYVDRNSDDVKVVESNKSLEIFAQ